MRVDTIQQLQKEAAANVGAKLRTQADNRGDELSKATRTICTNEAQARQEFRAECDIRTILKRFGVPVSTKAAEYGVQDDRITLQSALNALHEAQGLMQAVPEELRYKYPTWRHVLQATESGDYQKDLDALDARRAAAKEKDERLTALETAEAARAAQQATGLQPVT